MGRLRPVLAAGLLLASSFPGAATSRALPVVFADGVELVTNLPDPVTATGARLVGKYFYVSSGKGLHIYDVSDPVAPVLTGTLDLLHDPYYVQEDLDTNGRIALIGVGTSLSERSTLLVVDVSDKSAPRVVGALARPPDHTLTCIAKCRYAYADGGDVIDLRVPSAPRVVGSWSKDLLFTQTAHDVTEVAPGLVVTSSVPAYLLSVKPDPVTPRVLGEIALPDQLGDSVYAHGNIWPRRAKDDILLLGGEKIGPCSKSANAALFTFDVSKWRTGRAAPQLDSFHLDNGSPTDGNAAYNTNCAHWFDAHPTFRNGGLVTMAWYEHGTRILDVDPKGQVTEKGYFLPLDGSAWASYWITDEIVYTVDYNRGIDVLRVTEI
ncbi:MAG: hypothetical protein M3345_08535 [Actinomycetota bacterium]|nr:hypothetical protein [Actinomycetota bacterium]